MKCRQPYWKSQGKVREFDLVWRVVTLETASSSVECSRDKPPFSFVRGQDLTMWDIVWVSPQGHRSVSVSSVTTCMENLEMSGNLTAVGEMSGILLKVREMSEKIL